MKTKIIFPALLSAIFFLNGTANAQSEKIQTAIIYQLTRLIDWCPNGKVGSFTIGVLGDDPKLMTELNALQGRKVAEQSIEVKIITNIQVVETVNIVFVSRSRINELPAIVSAIGSGCTLVVADKPGAANQGATVSFVEVDGKIQFEINRSNAEKHSLTVNKKLYELAMNVF